MGDYIFIFQKIIIVVGLIGAVAGVMLIVFDGDISKIKGLFGKLAGKAPTQPKEKNKNTSSKNKQQKDTNNKYTQDFLDFDEIKVFPETGYGLIVRNNKKDFVGVIEVDGINYNLLSLEEREVLEDSFGKLLNGIDYPIQIYIQNRALDIEMYSKQYANRLSEIEKEINKTHSKIEFLKDTNGDQDLINDLTIKLKRLSSQYSYGVQIKNFIIEKSKEKNMLERRYYIVLSHRHDEKNFNEQLTYEELAYNAFFDISNRASSLISALQRANLGGKLLSGVELAELLYIAYNKGDSETYKTKNALRSRFSHYYSTAEPVELKAMRRHVKELEKERMGA